jgi:hypothetical protein
MASIAKRIAGLLPFGGGGRAQVTRQEQLDARPVRHAAVRWEKTDNEITIFIPLKTSGRVGMLAKLLKMKDGERGIQLDEVGSSVWEMCDGEHDIADLISMLGRDYKLSRREAEVAVREFLKSLAQRNLIGLIVGGEKRAKKKS